jgi:hypothetical protein
VNLLDAVGQVVDALDQIGIPYMLVGSFSSMYYSFPRSTTDVDFVIAVPDPDLARLGELLGAPFRIDPQLAFETVGGSLKNEISIVGTAFKIELFRLTETSFDQSRFARRRQVAVAGRQIWVPTAEDVIVQKLIWDRPRDREDVVGVIAINHQTLDRSYLDTWSGRLEITDKLLEAWKTAISAT